MGFCFFLVRMGINLKHSRILDVVYTLLTQTWPTFQLFMATVTPQPARSAKIHSFQSNNLTYTNSISSEATWHIFHFEKGWVSDQKKIVSHKLGSSQTFKRLTSLLSLVYLKISKKPHEAPALWNMEDLPLRDLEQQVFQVRNKITNKLPEVAGDGLNLDFSKRNSWGKK